MQPAWIGILAATAIAAPALASTGAAPATPATAAASRVAPAPVQYYVDINSASRKELMTLPGIGAAEAAKIIANRPYLTKTELVSKNVLPLGPFMSVRNLVVAMPRAAPKGRT